jgi:hypothetical protein
MRFFIILLFFSSTILAQTEYPRTTSPPLDTPMLVRQFWRTEAQSFSSGFDLRTLQREGLAVHSVADGYVSRIKISPFGMVKRFIYTSKWLYICILCLQKGLMLSKAIFKRLIIRKSHLR